MPLVITIHHNSETWIHFQAILGPKKPPLNRWVFFPGGNFWSLAWRGKSAKSRRTGIKCTKGLNLQGWVLGHPVDEHHVLLREKKGRWKKKRKQKEVYINHGWELINEKTEAEICFLNVCGMNEAITIIDIEGGNLRQWYKISTLTLNVLQFL